MQQTLQSPLHDLAAPGSDAAVPAPHVFFDEDTWAVHLGGEAAKGYFEPSASGPDGSADALNRRLESANDWGPKGYSMVEDRPWCYFTAGPAYCPKPGRWVQD